MVSGRQEQLDNGNGGGAGAGGDHFDFFFPLSHHFEGIGETGQGDDGGAVLVVVEDGDVAFFLQLALNLKAAGGGDIFQIDAAKGAGDEGDGVDKFVDVMGPHAKGEGIYPAEGLKEDAFALHHRHTGFGADVAQAQDGGAVGDDGAEIVPAGEIIGAAWIFLNFQAGLGHAGGVGKGEVLFGGDGDSSHHFQFSLPFRVEPERLFCIIHNNISSSRVTYPHTISFYHADRRRSRVELFCRDMPHTPHAG